MMFCYFPFWCSMWWYDHPWKPQMASTLPLLISIYDTIHFYCCWLFQFFGVLQYLFLDFQTKMTHIYQPFLTNSGTVIIIKPVVAPCCNILMLFLIAMVNNKKQYFVTLFLTVLYNKYFTIVFCHVIWVVTQAFWNSLFFVYWNARMAQNRQHTFKKQGFCFLLKRIFCISCACAKLVAFW